MTIPHPIVGYSLKPKQFPFRRMGGESPGVKRRAKKGEENLCLRHLKRLPGYNYLQRAVN